MALSITSCQQPTTPNEQPKKTPEEVLEILNSAEKTLQLPNFPTTDNNIETIELPATIKAENENVTVSWELTVDNTDYKLTNNKLSITRDLVAADCKLKATLKYDTKSVTKDFTKTIPAKLKYKWFDDPSSPEDSIEVEFFINGTFHIFNHMPSYTYSYKEIDAKNKTLIATIISHAPGWEVVQDLNGKPEITYNYKLNEDNSISIWPASETYNKKISITEYQEANDTSEETISQ